MSPRQRAAALACALLLPALMPALTPASACTLVLAEHRSARELLRLPLDPSAPEVRVSFTHSVLGTPVEDRYRFRPDAEGWRAHLIEERWAGEGYGLPIAAGPGETLERDGEGWRLTLDRRVHPLVVRPLPAQRMRVQAGVRPGRNNGSPAPLLLGTLSPHAIEMRVEDCPLT